MWEIQEKPKFLYGIVHYGKAAHDMKWLPAYTNSEDFIGTLAVALGNGEIHIYNPIIGSHTQRLLQIAPIEVFSIAGLVFSSIV